MKLRRSVVGGNIIDDEVYTSRSTGDDRAVSVRTTTKTHGTDLVAPYQGPIHVSDLKDLGRTFEYPENRPGCTANN